MVAGLPLQVAGAPLGRVGAGPVGVVPGAQLERLVSWVSSPKPSLSQSGSSRAERSRWVPVSLVAGAGGAPGRMSPLAKAAVYPTWPVAAHRPLVDWKKPMISPARAGTWLWKVFIWPATGIPGALSRVMVRVVTRGVIATWPSFSFSEAGGKVVAR